MFEFHSGFWINLHHFLYSQALSSMPQKGRVAYSLHSADSEQMQQLTREERTLWNSAASYYQAAMVSRDLLFDDGMVRIKNALEDAERSSDLTNVAIPPELKAVLLQAAPIYRRHWWSKHDTDNRQWIAQLSALVEKYGIGISGDMVRIYDEPWPQHPVRVDVVAYANWAGAYTSIEPTRPTISSTDSANQGTAALEIVFHETSHGMMDKVIAALNAAEKKLSSPDSKASFHSGSLWHAVLFYTAGELVAERVPGYVPYADKNGLWARAWHDPAHSIIEKDWKPHMDAAVTLSVAINQLISDLQKSSSATQNSTR